MSATLSLARGLALLELVAACPGGCSFGSLARGLELPNTTIARLLRALTGLGYLRHDELDGLYRPGERLGWLGAQEDAELRLRRCCASPLRELARRHQLCGLLLRWTGRHVVCLESIPAAGLPQYQAVGHVTVDLPAAPWGVFFDPGRAWPDSTALQRRRRASEVLRLRHSGWTRCWREDRRRLAAPIRAAHGEITGALVLVGPPERTDAQLAVLGSALAMTAARCSALVRQLGA